MTIKVRERNTYIATPRPNWASPPGVEYSFQTSIFTSRDGTEQREAMRQRPRMALKYTTAMTREGLARHQADMTNRQGGLWAVRFEWARVKLTVEHESGGNEITVSERRNWMLAGQQIIIETETHEDLFTIQSISGKTITLNDLTIRDYPVGTRVYLAYWCRAASNSDFTAMTSRAWQGAVRYEVNPGEGAEVPGVPNAFSYGFATMMLHKPNWRDEGTVGFEQERDVFDPGIGLMTTNEPWAVNVYRMQFGFTGMSLQQSEELIDFFKAMRGRQKSFWMPTWTEDIKPSDEQIGTAAKFKVEGEDFRNAYEDHPVFNTMIAFFGCNYQVNRITSISGTTDSEIGFENDWSEEINSATEIYWLVKVRFESDTLDVRWETDENAEVQYTVRTLPSESEPDWPVPEGFLDLLDQTEGDIGEQLIVQHWGDLPVEQAVPVHASVYIRLADLGITQEMVDAGEVFAFARFAGYYQEGTPLAGETTQFHIGVRFYDSDEDGPDNYYADPVNALPGETNSFNNVVLGPDVEHELPPVTIPPGTTWLAFRAAYTTSVTSFWDQIESTWGIARPQRGSLYGTTAGGGMCVGGPNGS